MNTLEDIFNELLLCYEKDKSIDVSVLMDEKAKELGLSSEGINKLNQIFGVLDAYKAKTDSLSEAKADGITREVWLQDELEEAVDKAGLVPESAEGIAIAIKSSINDLLKEGER